MNGLLSMIGMQTALEYQMGDDFPFGLPRVRYKQDFTALFTETFATYSKITTLVTHSLSRSYNPLIIK